MRTIMKIIGWISAIIVFFEGIALAFASIKFWKSDNTLKDKWDNLKNRFIRFWLLSK